MKVIFFFQEYGSWIANIVTHDAITTHVSKWRSNIVAVDMTERTNEPWKCCCCGWWWSSSSSSSSWNTNRFRHPKKHTWTVKTNMGYIVNVNNVKGNASANNPASDLTIERTRGTSDQERCLRSRETSLSSTSEKNDQMYVLHIHFRWTGHGRPWKRESERTGKEVRL